MRSWLRLRYQAAERELLVFDRVTDWSVLRRVRPYRPDFGRRRGKCIDRYYIEKFLSAYQESIRGSVAEVGSDDYIRLFGGSRVEHSDVIDVNEKNQHRTVTIDLSQTATVPEKVYDCIICVQTIFQIYDYPAAVRSLHKMLKDDGILLTTVPGICQSVRGGMLAGAGDDWWRFTSRSAQLAFGEVFGEDNVTVRTYGNVLTATALLQGLVREELTLAELDFHDPDYEVTIGVKATKSHSG